MSRLAPELFQCIIQNLHNDKRSLKNCSLVNRVFLSLARPHLFYTIFLYQTRVSRFLELCDHPLETISGRVRTFILSQNLVVGDEPEDQRMGNSPAFNTLLTWRSSDGKRTLATVLCNVSTLSLCYIGYWTLDDEAKKMLLEEFQSVKEFKLHVAGFDTNNELWPLITSFRNLESLVLGPIQPVKNESRPESFELTEKRPLPSSLQSIELTGVQEPEVIQWLTPCHTLRSFHCFFYNLTRDFTSESAAAVGQLLSSAGGSLEEFLCIIQVAESSRNRGIVLDERFHSHIDLTGNTNLRTIKLQIGDSMFQLPFLEKLTQDNTGSEPHLQALVIQNLSEFDLDWERLDTLVQHPVFSRLQEVRVRIRVTYGFSDIGGLSQSPTKKPNVDSEAARNMKEKMAEFCKKLPKTNNRGVLKLQEDYHFWDMIPPISLGRS